MSEIPSLTLRPCNDAFSQQNKKGNPRRVSGAQAGAVGEQDPADPPSHRSDSSCPPRTFGPYLPPDNGRATHALCTAQGRPGSPVSNCRQPAICSEQRDAECQAFPGLGGAARGFPATRPGPAGPRRSPQNINACTFVQNAKPRWRNRKVSSHSGERDTLFLCSGEKRNNFNLIGFCNETRN